jgi:hypothetical protein
MPEIGATLREARMRAQIDVTEVESATKIRAKYLRALEEEQWEMLPGPAFVKSFLRTYAEYLGLDGRMLVETYKRGYEAAGEDEPATIGSGWGGGRDRRPATPRGLPRLLSGGAGIFVGLVVLAALAAALYGLGQLGNDSGGGSGPGPVGAQHTTTRSQHPRRRHTTPAPPPKPTKVSLQLVPTAPVFICLVGADDTSLITAKVYDTGEQIPRVRSRHFDVLLGNNAVKMVIDGHSESVPAQPTQPFVYRVTKTGKLRLRKVTALPACTS